MKKGNKMERKKAPEKLKWDLKHIYQSIDELLVDFKKLEQNIEKYANFKGKLGKKDEILSYFYFNSEFECMLEKVNSYIMLSHDIDTKNNVFHELNEKLNILLANLSAKTAFIAPELASLSDEYFQQLLLDDTFRDYEYEIKSILDNRKFVLSEKEETALSIITKFANGFSEVYESLTQSDFKFKPVIVDGKMEILTQSTYSKFIESKDALVRKQAYNNLYEVFNQFSKTIAFNYINFAKMVSSDLELRGQKSVFDAMFYSKHIPEELFEKLVLNVNKHLELEQKYFQLIKSSLKLDNFGFQDIYQTLATNYDEKWSIEEQKEIVFNALSLLGTDYQNNLKTAFDNNWIDFCADIDKKSGGYMLGVYKVHPYILLNDNGGYDSLSTLAHELGHALHTYYSDESQPYAKHSYETFIAEIASTVNEILLNKYLYKNAKSRNEKLFYVSHYLQTFKGTVFRQVMFAEFEHYVYKKVEHNEALSPDLIDSKYDELLKNHFGDIVPVDNNIIHEWTRIPHFYTPYYVYQYATSFISAVYIANKIIENDIDMIANYKNMLKSGCDGYPLDILKKANIDLMNDSIYEYVFNDFDDALKLAEELIKSN